MSESSTFIHHTSKRLVALHRSDLLTSTVSLKAWMMVFTVLALSVRIRRSRGPLSVSICRSRQLSGPALRLRRLAGSHFLMTS